MMVSSGPALSAWESVRLRRSTWPDLRVGVSASDRERPLVAGVNCTLIARRIKYWALVALVLAVSLHRRERATLPWGFILSPSATLRVAGLAPRVKVEHPTV